MSPWNEFLFSNKLQTSLKNVSMPKIYFAFLEIDWLFHFGIKDHAYVALDRNPKPGYDTLGQYCN